MLGRIETIHRDVNDLRHWELVAEVLEAQVITWLDRRWCKMQLSDGSLLTVTPVLAQRLLKLGDRAAGLPVPVSSDG